MRKIVLGIVALGLSSLLGSSSTVKTDSQYSLSGHFGEYGHSSIVIQEFTPKGNPDYICIIIANFVNQQPSISCIPKKSKFF